MRLRVAAAILIDGEFVLVRHRKDGRAYHLLPGGGVKAGESLQGALVREVHEETGLDVTVGRLLFLNETLDPRGSRHLLNATFVATVRGGEIARRPSDPRVEAVDLVSPESLDTLDLRPPLAVHLVQAARDGFGDEMRYLGALWVEEGPSAAQAAEGRGPSGP
jgi:8-oxo-dGTP diphosphatase